MEAPRETIRINIVVEGHTEERFVKQVLAVHFGMSGSDIAARRVTTSRRRGRVFRGGVPSYGKVKYDLEGWLKQDGQAFLTTMFDLYALPADFPGYESSRGITDGLKRAQHLEKALHEDIGYRNFIPYLQVHEFEAMLFSAPDILDHAMVARYRHSRLHDVECVVAEFRDAERINDGTDSAPSKRLDRLYPGYGKIKVEAGVAVTQAIGLDRIREQCHHFDKWITRLENLPQLNQ